MSQPYPAQAGPMPQRCPQWRRADAETVKAVRRLCRRLMEEGRRTRDVQTAVRMQYGLAIGPKTVRTWAQWSEKHLTVAEQIAALDRALREPPPITRQRRCDGCHGIIRVGIRHRCGRSA